MVELNEQITWVPEHVKHGQFGKWLSNARDWSISRNRFWGSPIPVWKSDDPNYPRVDVYGSFAELEADFGVAGHGPAPAVRRRADPAQPRRPDRALDHAPGARGPRRLVRLRLHVVRAGALPVRERRLVRAPLPGRLHRRVHRPDPRLVLHDAHHGHGPVRPAGVPVLRQPRHRPRQRRGQDEQVAAQLPGRRRRSSTATAPTRCAGSSCPRRSCAAATWSSPSRASATACARCCCRCGARGTSSRSTPTLLAVGRATRRSGPPGRRTSWTATCWPRCASWSSASQGQLDAYDVASACDSVRTFLDVLSNWYIRRSRDRFWDGESGASTEAFDTLYTTLEVLTRVCAPLLPFTTEEIWRGLTGGRSVHLTDWPVAGDLPQDDGAGGRHGPGPRDLLGGQQPAQGLRPAGAAAAAGPHRGRARRRGRSSRSARSSPTRSTSARSR